MAKSAVLRIQASLQSDDGSGSGVDQRIDFTSPVNDSRVVDLSSGANTITLPTGTTAVLIIPPDTNTQTITVKGVSGDTGVRVQPDEPILLAIDQSVTTTFVITTGGAIAGVRIVFL